MRFSVSRQLGLGFCVVLGLTALSAAVAYVKIVQMQRGIRTAVDEAYPAALACRTIAGGLNDALAALRGYVILGDDPEASAALQKERAAAWREIDAALTQLTALHGESDNLGTRSALTALEAELGALRSAQGAVEDVAQTPQNIPSRNLWTTEAAPLADRIDASLAAVIQAGEQADGPGDRLLPLAELRRSFLAAATDLRGYLNWTRLDYKRRFGKSWSAYRQAHERAAQLASQFDPAAAQAWQEYEAARSDFEPFPEQLMELRDASDWNKAHHLLETECIALTEKVSRSIDALSARVEQQVSRQREELTAAARTLTTTTIAAALAAIAIGTVVAVVLSRRIVSGIRMVVDSARRLGSGDLSGQDIRVNSRDEIAELAASFNAMRAGLREMSEQIAQATENVGSTAAEILASTTQQAAAAKEQAATVQEITTTIEEIDQSGAQIGDRAREVAAAAEAASATSQLGVKATQEASATMETIREQVEDVAENIVSLSERTQTIGEIIATVSEIAEQSNLLALNASIEAVSAGEHGGRFAVVAHEMKSLAERAKQCTVQVRTILSDIQKGINTSVMLTEEAVKRVESGRHQSETTQSAIRQMTDSTEQSIQAFQQIVGGANQQQIGVSQVSQGVQDIRQAVKQTAASTSQLEKAAANLNALAQQLRTKVQRYRM